MADTDGDGQVSFEEFLRLMQHLSGMPAPQTQQSRGGFAGGRGVGGPPSVSALNRGAYTQAPYGGPSAGVGMDSRMDSRADSRVDRGYEGDPMPTSGVGRAAGGATLTTGSTSIQDLESFTRNQGLNTEALTGMYKRFLESDKDGSGRVDINEFVRMLRVDRTPFVERLFSMFDLDRTGLIDVKEFVVGMSNVGNEARDNKIKFAFSVYDLDGSGFIDSAEMRNIIRATNMSTDKQVDRKVEWLMKQCDTDGDGTISFEEFTALSKKFPNIVFPAFNLAGSMAGLA